jgi:hypothetical protein
MLIFTLHIVPKNTRFSVSICTPFGSRETGAARIEGAQFCRLSRCDRLDIHRFSFTERLFHGGTHRFACSLGEEEQRWERSSECGEEQDRGHPWVQLSCGSLHRKARH